MASAWSEEEAFTCSVCLETLKDPATLPCGHSYCLACIQRHWDKGDRKGQYSCPQCRQVFNPRPSLSKSTVLVEAMEKLRTNSFKQSSSAVASSAPPSIPLYLEVLPDVGTRPGSVYPQLPTLAPRLCPQHNQPLDLFCHEDKDCVCAVCCQHEHKGHHVLKPEEERRQRQSELVQMQQEVQGRLQQTERKLKELPHTARQHKALVQALQQENTDLFSELVKTVNVTGVHVDELLNTHEASLGSLVEGTLQRLEQEVARLRWRSEELSRLVEMQDHICFLKNFFTMDPLGQTGGTGESILGHEEGVVSSIRSVIKELQDSVQELCKASLAKITTLVNDGSSASTTSGETPATADSSGQTDRQSTVYEMVTNPPPLPVRLPQGNQASVKSPALPPSCPQASAPPPLPPLPPPHVQASQRTIVGPVNPEPKTREELLKFRFEPTMDPNTVYRHLQLSDEGSKAKMRAENLNPPDHPERFHFWRQVLCREPLAGSPYYWEVEWTGQKITIGVAYKEMERKTSDDKSRLGHNLLSWSLYWSGTGFSFWHNGQEKLLGSPKATRVGVYLDQHAGILSFYCITNDRADLIYRHHTEFTGPLYPGFRFWAGTGATVTICHLD